MPNMETDRNVARALLSIGAVGFDLVHPITYKSGIKAPVYCDNRTFPFHPNEWKTIVEGFATIIESRGLKPDVIAGVEAAGIPHSAALGFHTHIPSVFVRKQEKDHGTKKLVEGGDVSGKKVLLIEDLVTTGGSSLRAVRALREAGAVVTDVLVIVTYAFPESVEAFTEAEVNLHSLSSFPVILEEAIAQKKLTESEAAEVIAWTKDPHSWDNR